MRFFKKIAEHLTNLRMWFKAQVEQHKKCQNALHSEGGNYFYQLKESNYSFYQLYEAALRFDSC